MASSKKKAPRPATAPAAGRMARWLTAVGAVLLLTWGAWWFVSLRQPLPRLVLGTPIGDPGRFTTIPTWSVVGLDFQHNYAGAVTWLRGENPYRAMGNDPMNGRYIYPPLTLGAFAWTGLFPANTATPIRLVRPNGEFTFFYPVKAVYVWMCIVAAIVVLAVWRSWRIRLDTGLAPLPFVLIAGVTLISYPVMFELERGNCHALVLLAILGIVWSLRWHPGWTAEIMAAACVALATGIKGFPAVLIIGLLALRRYRAALLAGGLTALIVASLWPAFSSWLQIVRELTQGEAKNYYEYAHSLAMHWHIFWRDLHLEGLATIPATPAIAIAVFAVLGRVSWCVFTSATPSAYAWPYLLWLTATSTLVNKISIDYNLIFVPIALAALWDARDRWWGHVILAANLLWLQPLYIGINGAVLLLLKCLGIAAIGELICHRVRRSSGSTTAAEGCAAPATP